jgi:hypothetical protein
MGQQRILPLRWVVPLVLAFGVFLTVATAADDSENVEQMPERLRSSARLFSSDSPLNQAVPPRARIDPGSAAMVGQLRSEVDEKGWAISTMEYTVPLFRSGRTTERVTVHVRTRGTKHRVPIPATAFPSPGSDGHMTVIDLPSRCEYDFYRARRLPDGTWEAENFNALPITGPGIYPRGLGTRASAFANAAGLITPAEIRRGRIEHALVFTMAATREGGPVWPATSSDGSTSVPGAIPEGARLQLDPSLSLESLAPWQRVIARALQRYGMYLADTGGAVAIFAQHPHSDRGFGYPWGDVDYGYLPKWLVRHLRVLELPRQQRSVHRFVPNRCLGRP